MLNPFLEFGLFSLGAVLLGLQLLLQRCPLLFQLGLRLLVLRQLGLYLAPAPVSLARLLLGSLATLVFLGELFGQLLNSLVEFCLPRLQIIGRFLMVALRPAGTLLFGQQCRLSLLPFLPQS